ncbi:hypothetical protein AN220_00715 [Streptomyces nanshensis]|nr:hypothetical protein AN220_00715 [Streptomyces nanshensis]
MYENDTLILSDDDLHTHFPISHYSAAILVIDWILNNSEHTSDIVEEFGDNNRYELEMMSDSILTEEHSNGISTHACESGCEHWEGDED